VFQIYRTCSWDLGLRDELSIEWSLAWMELPNAPSGNCSTAHNALWSALLRWTYKKLMFSFKSAYNILSIAAPPCLKSNLIIKQAPTRPPAHVILTTSSNLKRGWCIPNWCYLCHCTLRTCSLIVTSLHLWDKNSSALFRSKHHITRTHSWWYLNTKELFIDDQYLYD